MESVTITNTFETKEAYLIYRKAFKELAHQKAITSHDMVIHNILRKRQPNFGFKPITKLSKLNDGRHGVFPEIYGRIWRNLMRWKQTGNTSYLPYVPCELTPEVWKNIYNRLDMWNESQQSKT